MQRKPKRKSPLVIIPLPRDNGVTVSIRPCNLFLCVCFCSGEEVILGKWSYPVEFVHVELSLSAYGHMPSQLHLGVYLSDLVRTACYKLYQTLKKDSVLEFGEERRTFSLFLSYCWIFDEHAFSNDKTILML